jgi:hypothetical protein
VPQAEFVDVLINADGVAGAPKVFGLDASRLVVDLPDMRNAVTTNTVKPEPNALVTQARIGEHRDPLKVRVVLDLKNPVAYTVTRQDTRLAIRLTAREPRPRVSESSPHQPSGTTMTAAPIAVPASDEAPRTTLSVAPQPRTPSASVGQAAATDSARNVYVAGYTSGTFEGHTNAGMLDGFVVKYDPLGATLWIRQFGTSGSDIVQAVATDADGNVCVAGYTYGSLDGQPHAGLTDLFVTKYDPQGHRLWTRQLGTSRLDQANGIATDSRGNVYVTGFTEGNLNGNAVNGLSDPFLVKYDAKGAKLWTRQFGTPSSDVARAVATDTSGHVYVTGSTFGHFDGKGGNAGVSDVFVVKYDAQGTTLWTRQFGTPSFDHAYGLAADRTGNVYVGGSTYGSLDGNRRVGQSDAFVARFNSQGVKLWTRQLGTSGSDVAHAVSTDASGDIYVAGYTSDGLDGNPSTGRSDLFVVKYDPHAAKLWTRQLGTPTSDVAQAVAADTDGNLYVAGYTNDSLDGNARTGLSDLFVIKFDGQGARLLTSQLGTTRS